MERRRWNEYRKRAKGRGHSFAGTLCVKKEKGEEQRRQRRIFHPDWSTKGCRVMQSRRRLKKKEQVFNSVKSRKEVRRMKAEERVDLIDRRSLVTLEKEFNNMDPGRSRLQGTLRKECEGN